MSTKIEAGRLETGNVVVETRHDRSNVSRPVCLAVEAVSHGRFTNYRLSDGSDRQLSPYVEVEVLTNAYYWCHQAPRASEAVR